jgi:hypothetical protein
MAEPPPIDGFAGPMNPDDAPSFDPENVDGPTREPGADAASPEPRGSRRSRVRVPLALAAALLVVLAAVVGVVAYEATRPPAGAPGPPDLSPPPGANGPPGITLAANGTTWSLGPDRYAAIWFSPYGQSELMGSVRSSSPIDVFVLDFRDFATLAPSNASAGTFHGNVTALAGAAEMERLNATVVDPVYADLEDGSPAYDLVFVNPRSNATASVQATSEFDVEPIEF